MSQTDIERLTIAANGISHALLSYGNRSVALDTDIAMIDVDRSIGNANVAHGKITDPYGTLKGCFLFAAYDSAEASGGEAVGVWQDGAIVWLSPRFTIESDEIVPTRFWATLDLNDDRKVEIIVVGGHGIFGGRAVNEYMWIFSWHDFNGTRINAVDGDGRSSIQGEGVGESFTLLSTHKRRIKAIGSGIIEERQNPSGAVRVKKGKKYCWNGRLYSDCVTKR